jgi:hypothetical protein
MTWTEKDKILFSTINAFGEDHLEAQIQDASKKFVKLKRRPEFFVVVGYYDLDKNEFVWQNDMNKMSADFVKKGYMPLFKTNNTLNKLFKPVVKFDRKDMNVIPYLLEIINAKFSVIRFKGPKQYIYALTIVDDAKETFKYKDFDAAMFIYRNYDEIEKKYGANKVRKSATRKHIKKERV